MIDLISRTRNITGAAIYVVGGKKEKDQNIRICCLNGLMTGAEEEWILNNYSQYSKEVKKEAARKLARKIEGQLKYMSEHASNRVENANPLCGVLSFSDQEKLMIHNLANERKISDEDMLDIIVEDFLKEMGFENTAYFAARHFGTNCTHVHFLVSYIDFDYKALHVRYSLKARDVCKKLEEKYGFVVVHDKKVRREIIKENFDVSKLSDTARELLLDKESTLRSFFYCRKPELTNEEYKRTLAVADIISEVLENPDITSLELFIQELNRRKIKIKLSEHKIKNKKTQKEEIRKGISFDISLNGEKPDWKNGGDINRLFTYGNIQKRLKVNRENLEQIRPKPKQMTNNHKSASHIDENLFENWNWKELLILRRKDTGEIFRQDRNDKTLFYESTTGRNFFLDDDGILKRKRMPVNHPNLQKFDAKSVMPGVPSGQSSRSNVDASKNKGEIDYGEEKKRGISL